MKRHWGLAVAALLIACPAAANMMSDSTRTSNMPRHASHMARDASRASKHRTRISAARARSLAEAKVPDGKLRSHEVERKSGRLVYSYDFVVPGKKGVEEVKVDGRSGKVSLHHESAKAERHERQLEARGKHA